MTFTARTFIPYTFATPVFVDEHSVEEDPEVFEAAQCVL